MAIYQEHLIYRKSVSVDEVFSRVFGQRDSVEEAKTNYRPQVSLNSINIPCLKMCPLPRRHPGIPGWRKNRHFTCGGPMAIFFSFLISLKFTIKVN